MCVCACVCVCVCVCVCARARARVRVSTEPIDMCHVSHVCDCTTRCVYPCAVMYAHVFHMTYVGVALDSYVYVVGSIGVCYMTLS